MPMRVMIREIGAEQGVVTETHLDGMPRIGDAVMIVGDRRFRVRDVVWLDIRRSGGIAADLYVEGPPPPTDGLQGPAGFAAPPAASPGRRPPKFSR